MGTYALADIEPWSYCNYDSTGIGFPRDCGPTGAVQYQWHNFVTGQGQQQFAFYLWGGTKAALTIRANVLLLTQPHAVVLLLTKWTTVALLPSLKPATLAKLGIPNSLTRTSTPLPMPLIPDLKATIAGTPTTGTKEHGATLLILMFLGLYVTFQIVTFHHTIMTGTRTIHSCLGTFLLGTLS